MNEVMIHNPFFIWGGVWRVFSAYIYMNFIMFINGNIKDQKSISLLAHNTKLIFDLWKNGVEFYDKNFDHGKG